MAALQAAAVEHGVGLDDCWAWSRERLAQVLSWPDPLLDRVERYRRLHGSSPQLKIPSNVLTPLDQIWPQGLNKLDRPPLVLHQQGGLAEGIDAAAHRGCLAADGVPVAVLGTPLDRVYPRHHQALQEEVARNGLLLSERQPGESVQPGHFAARNRLLVSLSCALVVVECPDRSGALISARLAAEQQCPVWVVPGDAGRWSSRGSNRLLQNAAAPLLSPKELVEHLGPGPCHKANATAPALVKALGAGASIEQLQQTLPLPAGRLASDLLDLELAGQVVCESGFLWKPCRP